MSRGNKQQERSGILPLTIIQPTNFVKGYIHIDAQRISIRKSWGDAGMSTKVQLVNPRKDAPASVIFPRFDGVPAAAKSGAIRPFPPVPTPPSKAPIPKRLRGVLVGASESESSPRHPHPLRKLCATCTPAQSLRLPPTTITISSSMTFSWLQRGSGHLL